VVTASCIDNMSLRLRIPYVGLQNRVVGLGHPLVPDFVEVGHNIAHTLLIHGYSLFEHVQSARYNVKLTHNFL
jgi:hypothetical protein